MSRHEMLVIPSRADSIPLVLGDAIQARLPVVVTDVGDAAGLVRRHQIGVVVEGVDPEGIARGIIEIRQRGVPAADWEAARSELSIDRAADELASFA